MPQLSRPVWAAIVVVILLAGLWWFLPNTVTDPASSIKFEYTEELVGRITSDDKTPLLIALHGNGDTPADFFDSLLAEMGTAARVILIRAPLEYPGGRFGGKAWPSTTEQVTRYGDALAGAISVLSERYGGAGKPLVTGFSGGAEMAYYLAAGYNPQFSYILPISGRLTVSRSNDRLDGSGATVIGFHARNDEVIPYSSGAASAKALSTRGIQVQWNEIEGGHLGIFTAGKALYYERLRWALQRARIGS